RLYASVTGETVGTNISKLIQSFEKYKSGDKKWLRKKKTESMTIGVVAILLTLLLITMSSSFNKNDMNMDVNSIYIIVLSWFVLNIGKIIRIKNTIALKKHMIKAAAIKKTWKRLTCLTEKGEVEQMTEDERRYNRC